MIIEKNVDVKRKEFASLPNLAIKPLAPNALGLLLIQVLDDRVPYSSHEEAGC
jgi:hypothetical protein